MLSAMAFFSAMGVFIRLGAEELHALEIVFFRNALALVLMMPWLARHGVNALRTKRLGLYVTRASVNVIGMIAGFTALTLIPLAEATALGFTAPLWATLGAALFLSEVLRARRITALVIGFVGMLIVLRPGLQHISTGALLALANAFLIAVTTLIVKKLTRTESPEAIVTWMVLMQTPLSLIPALWVWQWPSMLGWVWLWCLALCATLAHLCWTRACAFADISELQPIEFIKLPLIALFAYFIFSEVPSIWTWIGGTVIFASTAYITYREATISRERMRSAKSL